MASRRHPPYVGAAAGQSRPPARRTAASRGKAKPERKRSRLTLNQSANLKAFAVRKSMAYGYAITVWHTGAQEPVTGKVVRFSIVPEAMKLGALEGGSPLVMQFDSGATVPLERVNRIERAGT